MLLKITKYNFKMCLFPVRTGSEGQIIDTFYAHLFIKVDHKAKFNCSTWLFFFAAFARSNSVKEASQYYHRYFIRCNIFICKNHFSAFNKKLKNIKFLKRLFVYLVVVFLFLLPLTTESDKRQSIPLVIFTNTISSISWTLKFLFKPF